MVQMCPAKSIIVPFKKQMYSSGSIILSYKDDKCICVSIHAPTRGATSSTLFSGTSSHVSIHAPTRGATRYVFEYNVKDKFQSTHPRGVRPEYRYVGIAKLLFQSTHPRGVRRFGVNSVILIVRFQSTHPRGVRPVPFLVAKGSLNVSIHAPTRGATSNCKLLLYISRVSIHAPTRGATRISLSVHNSSLRFNPRTHEGCDPC